MTTVILHKIQCLMYKETSRRISLLKSDDLADLMVKRGIKKIAKGAFHIKLLPTNEKEPALDFLRRWFLRDEPLAKAVKLLEGPDARCVELENDIIKAIDEGVSVKAVDDNEKLVGIVINSISHRKTVENLDEIEKISNPKLKRIMRLLTYLEIKSQLWEKVPSNYDTVIYLKIASTDPKWRGRNIMKELVEETERVAKKRGAAGVHLVATSLFSAKAVERLGYKSIYCVKYTELPAAPQPEPPHREISVYLKLV